MNRRHFLQISGAAAASTILPFNISAETTEEFEIINWIENNLFLEVPFQSNLVPFKLYNFQKELIERFTTKDELLVTASRQMGMTSLCLAFSYYHMIKNRQLNNGYRIGYFVPNMNQCRYTFDKLKIMYPALKTNYYNWAVTGRTFTIESTVLSNLSSYRNISTTFFTYSELPNIIRIVAQTAAEYGRPRYNLLIFDMFNFCNDEKEFLNIYEVCSSNKIIIITNQTPEYLCNRYKNNVKVSLKTR